MNISDEDFTSKNPELHHYTTLAGLRGIVQNQSIWASHYLDLNDSTEIKLSKEPLTAALELRYREVLRQRQNASAKLRIQLAKAGGRDRVARSDSAKFVESLYRVTFEDSSRYSLSPFIASFCTHTSSEQAYERENGLLSQWRGYSGNGGFCFVFDTAELLGLLAREMETHYHVLMHLDAVAYAVAGLRVEGLFSGILDQWEGLFSGVLDGKGFDSSVQESFIPFVRAATLYKHQGFREECEARIVVLPATEQLLRETQAEHPGFTAPPLKQIRLRPDGSKRRYISIFEGLNTPLPIKRVIVGPSRHQDQNYDLAVGLLGSNIKVVRSGTPFIDQSG